MFAVAPVEARFPPIGNTFLNWEVNEPQKMTRSRSYSGFVPYQSCQALTRNLPVEVHRPSPSPNATPLQQFEPGVVPARTWRLDAHRPSPLQMKAPAVVVPSVVPESLQRASKASEASEVHSPITPSKSPSCGGSTGCGSTDAGDESGSDEGTPSTSNVKQPAATTLMLRNLPHNIRQKDFVDKLNAVGFSDLYDFVHVPNRLGMNVNKGYAFVNMLTPEIARSLIKLWHNKHAFSQRSKLDISLGHVQGFDANVAAWNSAKLGRIKNPLYRPWVRQHSSDGSLCSPLIPLRFDDALEITFDCKEHPAMSAGSSMANTLGESPISKSPALEVPKSN